MDIETRHILKSHHDHMRPADELRRAPMGESIEGHLTNMSLFTFEYCTMPFSLVTVNRAK
jgi:hypothetical protein